MYKIVPIDNNAVLYTEKPGKRVNFTLSVLTTKKKKRKTEKRNENSFTTHGNFLEKHIRASPLCKTFKI